MIKNLSNFFRSASLPNLNPQSQVASLNQGVIYSNFDKAHYSTPGHADHKRFRIGVQGAPFDRGQRKPGVEDGPSLIRSSGFIEFLREKGGHDVIDYGDLNFGLEKRNAIDHDEELTGLRNVSEVARANKLISESTSKIVRDGRIPLTLGGDHSIAIGTIHGVSEVIEDLAVLWVDAHADINTIELSESGNMHGMPLSFLLKDMVHHQDKTKLSEFSWVHPRISASNIAYIGLRDVDSGERGILDQLGISAFRMRDIDRLGIVELTHRALKQICPDGKRPVHVSFDIDVLDDLEIAGNTGTPVPGGFTLREALTLLEEVHDNANVVAVDLVEFNPTIGDKTANIRTATLAKHLLASVFGL